MHSKIHLTKYSQLQSHTVTQTPIISFKQILIAQTALNTQSIFYGNTSMELNQIKLNSDSAKKDNSEINQYGASLKCKTPKFKVKSPYKFHQKRKLLYHQQAHHNNKINKIHHKLIDLIEEKKLLNNNNKKFKIHLKQIDLIEQKVKFPPKNWKNKHHNKRKHLLVPSKIDLLLPPNNHLLTHHPSPIYQILNQKHQNHIQKNHLFSVENNYNQINHQNLKPAKLPYNLLEDEHSGPKKQHFLLPPKVMVQTKMPLSNKNQLLRHKEVRNMMKMNFQTYLIKKRNLLTTHHLNKMIQQIDQREFKKN